MSRMELGKTGLWGRDVLYEGTFMNLRDRVATTTALSRTRFARIFALTAATAAFLALDISAATAQIETVVVTARKRAENVQNVPVAVTALTGEKLDQYNITTINQVAAQTPQLIIQRGSSGSGADISLRGIGSSSENIGIEQSVAVNVDGVYLGQGRAINEGFFDMKQVEILKGPQALYFGKNATAGVISLETNDPTDEFEAMVRAGYEFTSDAPYIEGVVSGPVTDDLGLRLAVRGSDMFGGYIENQAPGGLVYNTFDIATGTITPHTTDKPEKDLPGSKNGLARLTAKWEPISDLTITGKLAFDAYDNRDSGYNIEPIICPLGHTQANPTETCSKNWKIQQNDFPQGLAASDPIIDKAHGRMFEQFQSYTGIVNAEYVTPEYTLSSVSGFQHLFNDWGSDQDFTGMPSVMAGEHFKWHAFSSENRILTTLDFPVNFSGGFYYQSTRLDFNQDVIFASLEDFDRRGSDNALCRLSQIVRDVWVDVLRLRSADLGHRARPRADGWCALHARDQAILLPPALRERCGAGTVCSVRSCQSSDADRGASGLRQSFA